MPDASRRHLLELQPGVLGLRERAVHVGELAGDAAHLDEVGGDRRRADRQLELGLAQARGGRARRRASRSGAGRRPWTASAASRAPPSTWRVPSAVRPEPAALPSIGAGAFPLREPAGAGAGGCRPRGVGPAPVAAAAAASASHGPAVGHGLAPGPVAAVERARPALRRPPTAGRRSSRAGAGRATRPAGWPGVSARNASIASRAAMSRWLVGSSRSSRFDGHDARAGPARGAIARRRRATGPP